jgi:hypothetical protein
MKDQNKMIEIICIWDRSGSMQSLVSDAIGGFNSFLERQKKDAPDSRLTLVLFHDYWEIVEDGAKITAVAPLNEKSYVPDRCTALYDTLGDTLKQVSERLEKTAPEARPSKVLVAIFTDGLENASIKYSSKQIQDLIKCQREIHGWEFLFLAANQDTIATGESIGVHRTATVNVHATSLGYQNVGDAVSFATSGVAGGQSVDSLNVQKHYDATLEEEEQKRKKK